MHAFDASDEEAGISCVGLSFLPKYAQQLRLVEATEGKGIRCGENARKGALVSSRFLVCPGTGSGLFRLGPFQFQSRPAGHKEANL